MSNPRSLSDLVLQQLCIAGFRATQLRQCKAQSAGNGQPLPRTATPQRRNWVAPVGQDDKRSSAVLHSLALATASAALLRLAAKRFSSCCIRQYKVVGVLLPANSWQRFERQSIRLNAKTTGCTSALAAAANAAKQLKRPCSNHQRMLSRQRSARNDAARKAVGC